MSEPKILTTTTELIGKTVTACDLNCGVLLLRFSDDSCALIVAEGEDEDSDADIYFSSCLADSDLCDLGYITDEEFNRRVKERREKDRAIAEAARRRQYEELKKEFGDA